VRRQS